MAATTKGNLIELFSSIQGEGAYVGYRQIFVRFSGCNLSCNYCDTRFSHSPVPKAQIEVFPGKRQYLSLDNPVDTDTLVQYINRLLVLPHHSVSFTGGEPLCQWALIKQAAPLLTTKIFLETNGTLPEALSEVIGVVDIISMDMKFPEAGSGILWPQHESFLRIAAQKEVFVKMVISQEVALEHFDQALSIISRVDERIPVILQPVTLPDGQVGVDPDTMLTFQGRALQVVRDVRVIPQTHKYMGQL